jgi:hypothetical protein
MEDLQRWAGELGMNGNLGDIALDDDAWDGDADTDERRSFDALLQRVRKRAHGANAESYLGKIKTMLHWLALYKLAFPNRTLILPLYGEKHAQNAKHNDETLASVLLFIREHGSIAKGRAGDTVRSDAISAVGSTFRAYRQVEAGCKLRVAEFNVLTPALTRQMRGEDGPSAERKLELGVGPTELNKAWQRGWDITSERGVYEWALMHTLIQVVGRGGEPGFTDDRRTPFEPQKDCAVSDVKFLSAEEMGGMPALDFWWFPIKDVQNKKKKIPVRITRTHHGEPNSNHLDPFDAIVAWWSRVARTLTLEQRKTTPLFQLNNVIVRTKQVAALAKRVATFIGDNPALVGAKSFRIAGASAIYHHYGFQEASHILERRGRWDSDVQFLYARLSSARQVEVSRRMALPEGTSMERSAGWTQPA